MKILLLSTLIILFTGSAYGQRTVHFIQDTSITSVLERYSKAFEKGPQIDGYRIQLIARSGNNSKKDANDVKATFLAKYPEVPAYVLYQQPNFKVRVGDFRDRFAAYRFYKELKADFPAAFIVRDEIAFPPLREEELTSEEK